MTFLTLIILSFVEGLTEFLPISSTGHLILASALLGINDDIFVQNFNIVIQFGAIGSVLVLYWRRFFPIRFEFYLKLFIAFLPGALLGLVLKSKIEALLGSVQVVAWALLIGGLVLLLFDRRAKTRVPTTTLKEMNWPTCVLLGLIQCLAFIPGVSRSGATILGGLWLGLSREDATEFSFFLAVPTLTAAGLFKGYKAWPQLSSDQTQAILLGTLLSFVFALLAIKFFVHLVKRYGLAHFGWYRIALGGAILASSIKGIL